MPEDKNNELDNLNAPQAHCHSGSCGCAGLADDSDEFYDFTSEQKPQPITQEKPHPKTAEELEQILASIPEIGGAKNSPEPTKFGDWAHNGKAVDF